MTRRNEEYGPLLGWQDAGSFFRRHWQQSIVQPLEEKEKYTCISFDLRLSASLVCRPDFHSLDSDAAMRRRCNTAGVTHLALSFVVFVVSSPADCAVPGLGFRTYSSR
jgi:hypothetical protein